MFPPFSLSPTPPSSTSTSTTTTTTTTSTSTSTSTTTSTSTSHAYSLSHSLSSFSFLTFPLLIFPSYKLRVKCNSIQNLKHILKIHPCYIHQLFPPPLPLPIPQTLHFLPLLLLPLLHPLSSPSTSYRYTQFPFSFLYPIL